MRTLLGYYPPLPEGWIPRQVLEADVIVANLGLLFHKHRVLVAARLYAPALAGRVPHNTMVGTHIILDHQKGVIGISDANQEISAVVPWKHCVVGFAIKDADNTDANFVLGLPYLYDLRDRVCFVLIVLSPSVKAVVEGDGQTTSW